MGLTGGVSVVWVNLAGVRGNVPETLIVDAGAGLLDIRKVL